MNLNASIQYQQAYSEFQAKTVQLNGGLFLPSRELCAYLATWPHPECILVDTRGIPVRVSVEKALPLVRAAHIESTQALLSAYEELTNTSGH